MKQISRNNTTTHTRSDMKDRDIPARNKIFLRMLRVRTKWILEVLFFALGAIILAALLWRIFTDIENNHWLDMLLGTGNKLETIKLLGTAIGAMAIIWNGYAFTRRAAAQENTAKAQFESVQVARQDAAWRIYNDARAMISNTKSVSARISGIYDLAEIARQYPERTENICNILCAHVRETTQQPAYQETYKDQPSNEMQSLLDVLTKRDTFTDNNQDDFADGCRNFSRSYLSGADLSDANLIGIFLSGANLSGAKLRSANLSRARLMKSDLSEADLSNTNYSGAYLSDADLSGADLWHANFNGADLSNANLSEASLLSADFSLTPLSDANFSGSRLSGANFSGSRLSDANFSGADLWGADFSGSRLSDANFSGSRLSDANFSGADLWGTNLSGTKLFGVNLSGANLSKANLQGSNLYRADLQDAELHDTQLHGAYCDSKEGIISFYEQTNKRRGKGTNLSDALNVPENIDEIADTGILTDEMADKIIAEYDKAIKESGE